MKKLYWLLILITTATLTIFLAPTRTSRQPDIGNFFEHVSEEWLNNDYWSDGQAEVNGYQATLIKYGQPRKTRDVIQIIVSESHHPKTLVKADDWRQRGLVPMLKFNSLLQVQTGVYPYRQMMSAFLERTSGRFAKMTFSSQEWCGNTFQELINFRGSCDYSFNSYWDGEGAGKMTLDLPGDIILYDNLPLQLRMLAFESGLEIELALIPSLFSNRAQTPKVEKATLNVGPRIPATTPWGPADAFAVVIESASGTDEFLFESELPHRMLQWKTRHGDSFSIRTSKKMAYWTLNQPGDETQFEDVATTDLQ